MTAGGGGRGHPFAVRCVRGGRGVKTLRSTAKSNPELALSAFALRTLKGFTPDLGVENHPLSFKNVGHMFMELSALTII